MKSTSERKVPVPPQSSITVDFSIYKTSSFIEAFRSSEFPCTLMTHVSVIITGLTLVLSIFYFMHIL
ncbi:hypothetical protein HQ585_11345 [candidate division KSB1 bacterium]|nr:hypothetical protein [candidate division KSB1 bacterium]